MNKEEIRIITDPQEIRQLMDNELLQEDREKMQQVNKKQKPKAKITNFNVNWIAIKSACMTTVSKEVGKEPNQEWKRKLLICQHSPIRRGVISWKWENIPYAISTHFARHHIGCEKYVGTQRADRTQIKDRSRRSQMDYVPMEMDANIQALINISEKRLCMCADSLTKKYWEAVLEEIKKYDEEIYWACVPQCVRCGSCVEPFSNCNYYEKLMKEATPEEQTNIIKRYDYYNKRR